MEMHWKTRALVLEWRVRIAIHSPVVGCFVAADLILRVSVLMVIVEEDDDYWARWDFDPEVFSSLP